VSAVKKHLFDVGRYRFPDMIREIDSDDINHIIENSEYPIPVHIGSKATGFIAGKKSMVTDGHSLWGVISIPKVNEDMYEAVESDALGSNVMFLSARKPGSTVVSPKLEAIKSVILVPANTVLRPLDPEEE
jgi:hypothetical protein